MKHQTETQSIWDNVKATEFSKLSNDISTEVCIVGSGISGLSIAYFLLKQGISVVILDKESGFTGQTTMTSGHLSNALDDRYHKMKSVLSEDGLKLAAESHTQAIDMIEEIIRRERISCDFSRVDGYLFSQKVIKDDVVQKELEATHEAGIFDTEIVFSLKGINKKIHSALRFPRQAQLHSLKYCKALQKCILEMGGIIYGDSQVVETKELTDISVKTKEGREVICKSLVFATNSPINHQFLVHTKEAAYRSYCIGIEVPKGSFPKILLWDTEDPYHYVRLAHETEFDIIIVGGEDHRVGQEKPNVDPYSNLQKWAKKNLGVRGEIKYRWSGQIVETLDGLGYIGKSPGSKNVYEVSGDSGHGLTHATIGASIITDLILGNDNPWIEIYDPSRISFMAAKHYIKENIQGLVQMVDWVTTPEVTDIKLVPMGKGMIISENGKKVAVYKDDKGKVHKCSAVCPHLGALVRWNENTKTWDCPWHGSRFDAQGHVLNGPSRTDLDKIEDKKDKNL